MELITSVKNEKIKSAVRLQSSKGREETGLFLVEGRKLIEEAVSSGCVIDRCFSLEGAKLEGLPDNVQRYAVTEQVMKKLSTLAAPQDHIAAVRMRQSASAGFGGDLILALDRLQDPSNLGAILRSAEAFGTATVVLGCGCCDPYSPKSIRAAMGSTFRLAVITADLSEYLSDAKRNGYTVIGTGLDRAMGSVAMLKSVRKKVIVIGNEGSGISDEVKRLCDADIYIPMSGKNESLNAAVAASIIMWENMKNNVE